VLPFPGGIEALPNGLLIFSAAAALLYLAILRQPASLKRAIIKTLSVTILTGLAITQGAPIALLIALLLACAGDFLLAMDGETSFQAGLSNFLMAQVALIIFFVSHYSNQPMRWMSEPWRIALAGMTVFHSIYLAGTLWRRLPRELGALIVAYAVVITVMGLFALAYAPMTVLGGVALFYFSDTLIAHEHFLMDTKVNQHPVVSPLAWITYYLAQTFILLGVLTLGGQ
jgi:uncharacterized membrane protein YhhN